MNSRLSNPTLPSDIPARQPTRLAPRIEEQRLLEVVQHEVPIDRDQAIRIATVTTGRGQAAEWIARTYPMSAVTCWFLDSYQASRTSEHITLGQPLIAPESTGVSTLEAVTNTIPSPSNLSIVCEADLPTGAYHLALLSMISNGEAELSRDVLQQMFHQLEIGGRLVVAVDNPDDRWVHDQLKNFEKRVKVRNFQEAVVYMIDKQSPLRKLKDFGCELAYRDCDELVHLITRPGVFSHRQLDNGARQLLDAVDIYPEARVIDIGCGSGAVALGLAKRDPTAHVHAVDSNARSIWCAQRGIALNQLENLTTEVNCTGIYGEPESFDMAVANPPYFGDFRIAEKFITAAHRSLRRGGRLVLVTKQPKWYQDNLERWFVECEVFDSRRYFIASGIKP